MKKRLFQNEFEGAVLGDLRRSGRLTELAMALAAIPDASLPEALRDASDLEAAYRFLGNEAVEANDVLGPHRRETATRCAERQAVIVAHDTTDFAFPGEKRKDLGRLRGCLERGFFAHAALAVSWDESRDPLGLVHLETWTRGPKTAKPWRSRRQEADRESTRWYRGVSAVHKSLAEAAAVHVMDREADAYDLLAPLAAGGYRFIVRSQFDRQVAGGDRLDAVMAKESVVVTREVLLSARKKSPLPKRRQAHPPRRSRPATLSLKAASVTLRRPRDLAKTDLPSELTVNVVLVEELHPAAGEPPVSWLLYTTEPIDSPADVERIVDGYRCRWRIEEFFKALKTGCEIEKRQLESYHSLLNCLAIYIPIAWRALRHRTLAHSDGGSSASAILTPLQVRILRRATLPKLAASITLAEALAAIAAMGGHLKCNGPPGWITLARGYERLLTLEEGALLMAKM